MIRLLVSDIDGTLVTPAKELTAAIRAAVARLAEAGVALALTSSRAPPGVSFFADALGLATPRAAFNSGTIYDANGTVLRFLAVPPEALRLSLAALGPAEPWLFTNTRWLLRNPAAPYVAHEEEVGKVRFDVVEDFGPYLGEVGKLTAVSTDHASLAAVEADLQQRLAGLASARRSQSHYLDITHPEATKGEAVRQLAALLNVPLAETAAIGDMVNDIPMFEVAAHAIAMGNAPDEVKARAHHVTAPNTEEGWARAIEDFVLPRAP